MAFPDAFLDELRARLSISDVVGRKVLWDMRKSNRAKGDWWAPCPFHQEKTASFHVDDRKGFYYCFGCQAKGNAIGFVMETENVGFHEAVEILAAEVGLPVPAQDRGAQARQDRHARLTEAMERALRHYRMQLASAAGTGARAYLAGRRLDAAACERWEIGFAPPGWEGLREALTAGGVALDDLVEAGLARPSDKGRAPYDLFRDRIMFPIRDARGRVIAFGARAMDPGEKAKYINSPETPLFDKGRNLYNHGRARAAVAKGQRLIVAEGYMDVIALGEAGFAGAVAPLGTAITEHQLRLLWQISDEPVIALDGDGAGLRAAYRLVDLALPLIEAGKSLRFALMPDGKDPDEVIRDGGPEAMEAVLEAAEPMVTLLWRRATEGRVLDSPERRAALDRELRTHVARIADPSIRSHYGAEIRNRREALFGWGQRPAPAGAFRDGQARWNPRWSPRWTPPPAARATTRASLLARGDDDEAMIRVREAVVLATMLTHPALIELFVHALEEGRFATEEHAAIAEALLACDPAADADTVRETVVAAVGAAAVDRLMAPAHVRLAPSVRCPDDPDRAAQCLAEELAKLAALRGIHAEVAEAEATLAALEVDEECDDDPLTFRLRAAAEARALAARIADSDSGEVDIAENGVRIDRTERRGFDALLAQIDFSKAPRRP